MASWRENEAVTGSQSSSSDKVGGSKIAWNDVRRQQNETGLSEQLIDYLLIRDVGKWNTQEEELAATGSSKNRYLGDSGDSGDSGIQGIRGICSGCV